MPLFEYQCRECGQVFEVLVRPVSSPRLPACPKCKKTRVERLWSPFATQGSSRGECGATADGIG